MGSRGLHAEDDKEEVKSFGSNHINPSNLIASNLPASFTSHDLPNINVKIITATPIPVKYHSVREIVPRILFPVKFPTGAPDEPNGPLSSEYAATAGSAIEEGKSPWDFVLHIGMAAPRRYYTLETCAHRDGYVAKDEAGETMEDDTRWSDGYKSPEILKPAFDFEDVWRRWKSDLIGVDVRPSNDAGHYLCDFIYYSSLVEFWRRDPDAGAAGGGAHVMFLHVPGYVGEVDIEMGRKVALGLIAAMVASTRRQGKKGSAEEGGEER
ncbi:MAG: hypothetical protein LQ352_002954 [Teloschistes flavicans]|nr:MAG: hypothetical protein LQ352_002954 [Teloschistes flavicans]